MASTRRARSFGPWSSPLRAYEASGRTVAEFAEMYGMDPAEASRTLERARASR